MTSFQQMPIVQAVFVQADISSVLARFRGESLSAEEIDEDGVIWWEVTGEDARIKEPLGFEALWQPDVLPWLESRYAVRGSERVSVVRSNPEFVLVEEACSIPNPYRSQDLKDWVGAPIYEFFSAIGPNPMQDVPDKVFGETHFPQHIMFASNQDNVRYVSTSKEGSWKFESRGEMLPFERPEYYQRRFVKDRFNREIMGEYLAQLGIDPEATFVRRELDDPHLFTVDHEGDRLVSYQADKERYQKLFGT